MMQGNCNATDLQQDTIELNLVFGKAFAQGCHFGQGVFKGSFLIPQFGEG